jgi:thiamine biosynthesis lipoprotein
MLDGKRYCHIIDPRTGYPAQGVQAVTVLIHPGPEAGTLSDVASKPMFISGVAGWRRAASDMGVADAMLIDDQGAIHVTAGMAKRVQFTDPKAAAQVIP